MNHLATRERVNLAGRVGTAVLAVSLPSPGSSSARSTYSHRLIFFRSDLEMVGIPCPTSPLSEAAAAGSGTPVREWSSHADQGMSEVGGSVADAVAGCCALLEDEALSLADSESLTVSPLA